MRLTRMDSWIGWAAFAAHKLLPISCVCTPAAAVARRSSHSQGPLLPHHNPSTRLREQHVSRVHPSLFLQLPGSCLVQRLVFIHKPARQRPGTRKRVVLALHGGVMPAAQVQ